ncbi:MAG: FAD:protein FMN transferase [Candidatus Omnitrophica bacterium]|nr:FAD:protein FMN transferase [Candidatus Omnitrophota bacterium]MBU4303888.1 FAD:protein FMN transferase [Candidatus Omnitrophota bacterium]MBU4467622.1 FAD:protein FMN transferase [Candidatus Omnitrophota bacterium]MCG2707318.1 FAD:protein FMN transferase [Candidatus Omnitrophota bacterium]
MAFSAKTRKFLVAFLISGWSIALIYSALRAHPPKFPLKAKRLYHDNRLLMGTFWQVSSPNKQASGIVFSEASSIEQLLSKYIPASEISRLNRLGKLKVSADTFYIIKKSLEFYRQTQGAFDITVAPLVDLWGFTGQNFQKPGADKIRAVLELVGSDKIILHEKDNVVEFKLPGMKIDLGAIAKGFALDCAVKKLKENNIASCLINAGGQVYALGDNFGQSWKIAIQGARKPEITGILKLKNKSASTSGDYQQYFLRGNKRYGHILNPKTGYPAESGISSVTVIADSALEADALSTSVFVLGKEKAKALAMKFNNLEIKITE